MHRILWKLSVFRSRWRDRFRYLPLFRRVYRNWWAVILPKCGVSVVLELRNGLRYLVRSGTTDLGIINDAAMLNPYLIPGFLTLREDAIVVDVGANIGDFTMQSARACPRGRVIAVEPVADQARMIAIQVILNQIKNVTIVQAALGDHEGQTEIHVEGGCSSAYFSDGSTERVRLTTLLQLMRETTIDHIDLLKLDCEGAEWDVLPSAEELLPKIRQISMEFHNTPIWTGDKLAAWLRERGYDVRWSPSARWTGMLSAVRVRGT